MAPRAKAATPAAPAPTAKPAGSPPPTAAKPPSAPASAPPPTRPAPATTAAPATRGTPATAATHAPPATDARMVNAPARVTAAPVTQTTALARAATPTSMGPLATAPAWLREQMGNRAPLGLDKVDKDDLIIPRIALAQPTSPCVTDGTMALGSLYDNVSKTVLAGPGEALRVIPIVLGKSRIMFGDYEKDEGIMCRSDDGLTARPGGAGVDQGNQPTRNCADCIRKEWDDSAGDEGGAPECTNFNNVLVLLPDFGMVPYVLSFKSSAIKVSRRFLSTAKQTGADFFALAFEFWTVNESNGKNTYKNLDFRAAGWVNESEYNFAARYYKNNIDGNIFVVDFSDAEGGGEPTAGAAPADDDAGRYDDEPAGNGDGGSEIPF